MEKLMIDQLIDKIIETKSPFCIGLDPHINLIPQYLLDEGMKNFGKNLTALSWALFEFNKGIIDALESEIACIKPQIAFYEQFGIEGLYAFKKTIDYAQEKGLYVIADVKRNDIGSTSEAYARAYLGKVELMDQVFEGFPSDFATVNGYLGEDGLIPFINECRENNKGIFVLAKTSNPSSGQFQDQIINGKPLFMHMADLTYELSKDTVGSYGYTCAGIVVGATYPETLMEIKSQFPHLFVLIPGIGKQGGSLKEVKSFFHDDYIGGIINNSRSIIFAYHEKNADPHSYALAAYDVVKELKKEFNSL